MAGKGRSPQVGYNTNIRHKSKLYHIQTEDSGVDRPYITTHLFVDGGRIIATRKTDYSNFLKEENLEEIIRNLMMKQHKAMAIALKDCVFDKKESQQNPPVQVAQEKQPAGRFSFDTLERAAEARVAESAARKSSQTKDTRISAKPAPGTGEYRISNAPRKKSGTKNKQQEPPLSESIFGSNTSNEKSLDEVILSYLSQDAGENDN
jgi:hypothetical protein